MAIEKLTKEIIQENIDQLLKTEKFYSDNEDELWNKDKFLLEREGKFELSRIAFENKEIAGYIIISIKTEGELRCGYVHKTFINPNNRTTQLYLKLFLNSRKDMRKLGIDILRWKCSPDNKRVYEHHLSFADEIIGSEEINGRRYDLFQRRI